MVVEQVLSPVHPMARALLGAAPLPKPQQDPATTKAKATAILNQRQFRAAKPSWFTQVLRWIGDHLLHGVGNLVGGGPGVAIAWVVILACVIGVIVLLVFVGRTVQPEPERGEPEARVELRRTAADWRAEAEALEAKGDWKGALRCRYRALVGELVIRRLVRDLPGRTTGEYRADVAASLPEAGAEFGGASELFERAWYGDRPTGPDESRRFDALAEGVVSTAGRASRPGAAPEPPDAPDPDRDLVAP